MPAYWCRPYVSIRRMQHVQQHFLRCKSQTIGYRAIRTPGLPRSGTPIVDACVGHPHPSELPACRFTALVSVLCARQALQISVTNRQNTQVCGVADLRRMQKAAHRLERQRPACAGGAGENRASAATSASTEPGPPASLGHLWAFIKGSARARVWCRFPQVLIRLQRQGAHRILPNCGVR